MRGHLETGDLTFLLCLEVREPRGRPAAVIGVTEEILHTAGDEVALLAGESHGGTRVLQSGALDTRVLVTPGSRTSSEAPITISISQ